MNKVSEHWRGFERERGRENGSFPVAEILKPMGFRTQFFPVSERKERVVKILSGAHNKK